MFKFRNSRCELQDNSLYNSTIEVTLLVYALGVIRRDYYNRKIDVASLVIRALYYYEGNNLQTQDVSIEDAISVISKLPNVKNKDKGLITSSNDDLIGAAELLAKYLKYYKGVKSGNQNLIEKKIEIGNKLRSLCIQEVTVFLSIFKRLI